MTSRLDRLFVLLESESSPVTRRAAARQLGEVQKLHPHELHNLLGRVLTYLRSSAWDTRIAAGYAIEAIVSNVPQWKPPGCSLKKESQSESQSLSRTGRLNFQRFDIGRVLSNSTHLLGSEGNEYDLDDDGQGGDPKERMARQRQQLNARLGLDVAASLGIDTSDIVSAQDLATSSAPAPPVRTDAWNVSDMVQKEMILQGGLSSREMNRARRKARMAISKQRSREAITEDGDEPERKRLKIEGAVAVAVKQEDFANSGVNENVPDVTGSWGDSVEWPFETFADQLSQDLLSPKWEVRHGAATALRELLKVHGDGAGKAADVSPEEMDDLHQLWLEDVALRLLCVLALDRFGDFVSDQVVAPVRETCAQTLGTVLNLMSAEGVHGVLRVLLQLLVEKDWEARHGGLLGLKYLLAVREDMLTDLLPIAYPQIVAGLCDPVDDVGAVAASALIPVVETVVKLLPDQVENTVQKLWDLLLDQDELTAACNSFMGLLAALISLPQSDSLLRYYDLNDVLPRLWPFLSHSTSSVRRVTLQTLDTLTAKSREDWNAELLQTALRHVYQLVLIEPNGEIQSFGEKVWGNLLKNSPLDVLLIAACPYVGPWMCLAMQPARSPFDSRDLIRDRPHASRRVKAFAPLDNNVLPNKSEQKLYIGGADSAAAANASSCREENVIRTRCVACRMLGLLSCYVVLPAPGIVYPADADSPVDIYAKVLLAHLNSKSAVQRQVAGLLMAEWGRLSDINSSLGTSADHHLDDSDRPALFHCPTILSATLHSCLVENLYFDEIRESYTRLLEDTYHFISRLKHYKVPVPEGQVLTLEQIQQFANNITHQLLVSCKLKPKIISVLEESQQAIQRSVNQTTTDQASLNISTQSALAQAVVSLNCLPEKLHPVFKPLMESIKKEESPQLQLLAAEHLAQLVGKCCGRNPCPNDKVVTNLCVFLRSDPDFTPRIQTNGGDGPSNDSGVESTDSRTTTPTPVNSSNFSGILTLSNRQKAAEGAVFKKVNPITGRGPGRPPLQAPPPQENPSDESPLNLTQQNLQQKKNAVTRRGSIFALKAIVSYFGERLKEKFPKLWDMMVGQLMERVDPATLDSSSLTNESAAQDLIGYLQVLEVTSGAVHKDVLPQVLVCLPKLSALLKHPYMGVRHMAARCIAALAALFPGIVMNHLVTVILPILEAVGNDAWRQGAVEAVVLVVEKLQTNILPYVVLLVVPLLGRMSDPDKPVRQCATHAFATLIQLMPLDGSVPDPEDMSVEITQRKDQERFFISQLFNPKQMEDYKVPVPIDAQLRSYQQNGVNWLAFLNKYKLHGILCDDMGLGKTLQSICILAGDHYTRSLEYKRTGRADCAPLRSLVICPPTLTGHWVYEVRKFLSREYLNPLQYAGLPADRERLRNSLHSYNLIIASYDIVRKDIDFFSSLRWNYCILDEGQYIKNGKTKVSKAIKQIIANHRIILSGTPIQNNVLELWSLFDFLMPGYLGTERQFNARYSRPILASREAKSSQKEQEAGVLAMEALHRQVLPFLLRRMKEDVLQDLPPKITQDYYCDLSPLQEALYEDFARSPAHEALAETIKVSPAAANTMQANTHVFQALRYLQKVCNHPKLVLTPSHPEYNRITSQMVSDKTSMEDIQHAAKLPALKQLLLDCGIGCGAATDLQTQNVSINQHRALIFCQLKMMLDIIENDLLKHNMHGVSYLRLDGSVPAAQRHAVVTRFNKDPSIDVLLLTTQVGGLGLNLTGADTVIFVEHDWNPMKDLQAMDRAHRIGQKKVVNVYRLITRGTLEEKIMGLQKFKLLTANTVITSENAAMETMGTDQLLDLFSLEAKGAPSSSENQSGSGPLTMKSVLSALPELWDDKQYEEEFDLTSFISSLRK